AWLSHFRVRVTLTYLVIFLLSETIMAMRAGSGFARTTLENAEHDRGAQAIDVASALAHPGIGREGEHENLASGPALQTLAGRLAANSNSQSTILDPFGNPIATSIDADLPNQRDQTEVAAALAGRMEYTIRADPATKQKM